MNHSAEYVAPCREFNNGIVGLYYFTVISACIPRRAERLATLPTCSCLALSPPGSWPPNPHHGSPPALWTWCVRWIWEVGGEQERPCGWSLPLCWVADCSSGGPSAASSGTATLLSQAISPTGPTPPLPPGLHLWVALECLCCADPWVGSRDKSKAPVL